MFTSLQLLLVATILSRACCENDYLGYVKDGCFQQGDALSCIKYKAIKVATTTLLGAEKSNETLRATNMLSFVHLDPELVGKVEREEFFEPRSFMSEWSALTKYVVRVLEEFVVRRGLKVELPEGTKAVEEEERESKDDQARGKRKKLAVILPLLSLLATLKTKVLLIPVLLAVLFIKKLLLVAALLVPSLLSTLKACKIPQPTHHYSHFGSSDSGSEFSSGGYGGGYSYAGGSPPGYGKDWAASRAYAIPKRPPPMYATAPGTVE